MRNTIIFISLALLISLIVFIKQKNKRLTLKGPEKVTFNCGPTELETSLLELEILIEAVKNVENHSDMECREINVSVSNILAKIEFINNLAQSYEDPGIANLINQYLVNEIELIKILISKNVIYCTDLINKQ